MKIIGLQLDIAWEQPAVNCATVRRRLEHARPPRGALVALPEMFATGFSMNAAAVAEPEGGPVEQCLSQLAREHGIWLVGGVARRGADGRARNQALIFAEDGSLRAVYTKLKPFTPGNEPEHYVAGEGSVVFAWQDLRVAPFICYDLRFPELFRQVAAAQRPELFVVIANFPAKREAHWLRLLQARAIENQAYVLAVNRVGADPFYEYGGRSLVVNPQGDLLADAGRNEGWISADLDLANLRQYRAGLPFLDDLRPG